ncbi:type IV pilus assembly protein PilM [Patescibacteria group bacterium]|nr:type IV pilus assembly protein PilM [Patescibacteria group bacterium]
MGLFSKSKTNSFIGIDIGLSGIKLVELANDSGHARLVTYAYVDRPVESFDQLFGELADDTAKIIKQMISKAKCTTKSTITAVPVSSIFTSIISVPANNEKELKEAIIWQAKKLIPMPLEEIQLDSKVIEGAFKTEGQKKVSRVLLTGAPKNLVNRYIDLLNKRCGLNLVSLETETFAQVRSLVGKDRSSIMIIDIGFHRTNISVVDKGVPFLNRSIAVGGDSITQTISQMLGIPYQQAETMKRDIRSLESFAPTGDLNPMLSSLMKPILNEIKYSFSLYQGQGDAGEQRKIDKIILTGGSALLPRLAEFLTQAMNVNAYLGDPWARVVYPLDLRPILDEVGTRFAVSIGCAMRDITD